jgi:hypothetical protein
VPGTPVWDRADGVPERAHRPVGSARSPCQDRQHTTTDFNRWFGRAQPMTSHFSAT